MGPFAGVFVQRAAQREKGEKKQLWLKDANNRGFLFLVSPWKVVNRHNRAGGCPAQRGGRVLVCYDGLNRMSLHPDLASRLTKGPFVTPGKECCEVATATQGQRLNVQVTFQMGSGHSKIQISLCIVVSFSDILKEPYGKQKKNKQANDKHIAKQTNITASRQAG